MTDNVIKFYPNNAASNPDFVLEQALGEYESVFIIGWNKDESLEARASLNMKQRDLLWLIEKFKTKMMNGEFDPYEEEE